MPVTVASSLLAMVGIFNVVGTISSGWLTDRINPHCLLGSYYALRGLLLMFLPAMTGPTVQLPLISFVVLFGVLDVATVPPPSRCAVSYGEDSAIAFGRVLAAHQLGAGLVAFGSGVARAALGSYDLVWMATGPLCCAAAMLAVIIQRPAHNMKHGAANQLASSAGAGR
ncbi:hypothetical protein AB0D83_00455 [Streptomyces decoyicus]|uniref:hypothetical protein n=1 Tax=Streptomyces decoyicus TaxID=249567 RepID=UPI0033C1CA82